jgi:hypothetical protein
MHVVDLDGDGLDDLVLEPTSLEAADVFLGADDGVFAHLSVPVNAAGTALGDFDMDGDTDFAWFDEGFHIMSNGRIQ